MWSEVLLREALSSKTTQFAKLIRSGQDDLFGDVDPVYPQANEVDPHKYRMNRKLNPAERAELAEQYRIGTSALDLARRFKIHRQTVAAHLKREGVAVRRQLKMTPDLIDHAKQLYAEGQSLANVGKQLGVEASTVGKAIKRAGVQLRPPVADRRRGSRDE
jgi:DNA-directed RNA polymerase specialized sigma24 family protein